MGGIAPPLRRHDHAGADQRADVRGECHYYLDYGVWGYPLLEADYAQHFTEALFGRRHTFTFERSARSDEVTLRFCPRNRKQSGLEGTLQIGVDGRFISARWQY